jgi:hypothetical protein
LLVNEFEISSVNATSKGREKRRENMLFPYDNFGPSFTALQQPQSQPLQQPQSAPTTMFNGTIPAFQAHPAPADPPPIFHSQRSFAHVDPIFTAGTIEPVNAFSSQRTLTSVGRNIDIRG